MSNFALSHIQTIATYEDLLGYAKQLLAWLLVEVNENEPFAESRAKALLRATEVVDDPTLHDFARLVENENAVRVALSDLLEQGGLAEEETITNLPASTTLPDTPVAWLTLVLAAFAHKKEYWLGQLDPASPPGKHSPAGQVVKNAGNFLRQQVQRSVTDRDRLAKKLAYDGTTPPTRTQNVDELDQVDTPMVPAPDVYRPPIPVRYPEMNDPMQVTDIDTILEELPEPTPEPPRSNRLVIDKSDLAPEPPPPALQPAIKLNVPPEPQRPPVPLPPSAVIMPNAHSSSRPSLTMQVKEKLTGPPLKSTKLRISVQEHPDGRGYSGVQVRVECRRIRAKVAGTTNEQGVFLCEVPVRENEGLTYDVEVQWPRDLGDTVEKKSMTLNADRTEFSLPFYHRMSM